MMLRVKVTKPTPSMEADSVRSRASTAPQTSTTASKAKVQVFTN
eukprot:CAMPEP_0170646814 /NCGR_PEP_ID=MMETSP0224-20130122/43841_1 /TAXON_ID=285029 /ORGANISM="Togula jolla, Strain CCCM 725" /LENGTH=43 /DNA_ID= /DNA_START= /DNA_END= /DNA_ORIENTATION=